MKKFFSLVHGLFFPFMGILCLIFFNQKSLHLELLSHFYVFFFLASLLYLALYMWQGKKFFLISACVACCVTAYPWVSLLIPPQDSSPPSTVWEDISVLQWNMYYKNQHPLCDFLTEVALKQPDILILQEITPKIAEELKGLSPSYPYRVIAPQSDSKGMIVWSKLPFKQAKRHRFQQTPNHYTILELETLHNKIPFQLIELHAMLRFSDYRYNHRQKEFAEISSLIVKIPGHHKVLIGDLNVTPYSPYFRHLQKKSGLHNGMQGHRIQGTWPSYFPFFLRIPIDHVLVSKHIQVIQQSLGQSLGSDHFPVLSCLRIYR